jgi:hypothetical protein
MLGLPAPTAASGLTELAAIAALSLLLGLALAQPALRSTETKLVRTDAEVYFVLDTSRSMLAAESARGPTRLDRAREAAARLRTAVPDVRAGLASMTDRLLPHLFPTADAAAFAATLSRAIAIEQPPPLYSAIVATDLGSLAGLRQGYYAPGDRRRVAIVLTDGESRSFNAASVGRALDGNRPIDLVVVRFWSSSERVFRGNGVPEAGYHPTPQSQTEVDQLVGAAGGRSFDASHLGDATAAIRADLGTGPERPVGRKESARALAPYVGIAALLPLLLLLRRRNLPERSLGGRRGSRATV